MALQDEILSQLGDIQRALGQAIGTVEALQEEVKTQGVEAQQYREHINSSVNNILMRVGAIEQDLKGVKNEIENVQPLVAQANNARQRRVGLATAWGAVLGFGGFLTWLITTQWEGIRWVLSALSKLKP